MASMLHLDYLQTVLACHSFLSSQMLSFEVLFSRSSCGKLAQHDPEHHSHMANLNLPPPPPIFRDSLTFFFSFSLPLFASSIHVGLPATPSHFDHTSWPTSPSGRRHTSWQLHLFALRHCNLKLGALLAPTKRYHSTEGRGSSACLVVLQKEPRRRRRRRRFELGLQVWACMAAI